METLWLVEQAKTVRNLCDITLLLIEGDRIELIPTVVELLLVEAQQMVDDHCIAEE